MAKDKQAGNVGGPSPTSTSRVTVDPNLVVEIHLPDALYARMRALQSADIELFDQLIVEKIFPPEERFGMEHVRLVKKTTVGGPTVPEASYRKTCSSG